MLDFPASRKSQKKIFNLDSYSGTNVKQLNNKNALNDGKVEQPEYQLKWTSWKEIHAKWSARTFRLHY